MVVGSYLIATAAVAVLALLILSFFAVRRSLRAWADYRGPQVIVCPENHQPAGVNVDLRHAGKTSFFGAEPDLRLSSCSRWPEKAGCGQECLSQLEAAPGECSVRSMLEQWYRDKPCVFCRKTFGEIRWHDHKPSLVDAEGSFVEWGEIPAEKLPEMLNTHFPVCWNCDTIERFRRDNPDLVTDISGRDRASGVIR
jgi:hypothetical protein